MASVASKVAREGHGLVAHVHEAVLPALVIVVQEAERLNDLARSCI